MCQNAVALISKALHGVNNAESILKIKNLIALFMQATDVSLSSSPDNTGGPNILFFTELGISCRRL
jgi:hypothetical protein